MNKFKRLYEIFKEEDTIFEGSGLIAYYRIDKETRETIIIWVLWRGVREKTQNKFYATDSVTVSQMMMIQIAKCITQEYNLNYANIWKPIHLIWVPEAQTVVYGLYKFIRGFGFTTPKPLANQHSVKSLVEQWKQRLEKEGN